MEENSELDKSIVLNVWNQIGITFDEETKSNRHRRLQAIYQQ
jgi:hypothetical protein